MDAAGEALSPLLVEHVTKRFRQGSQIIEALNDVSLTVGRGEFVAIMGASGSGKSTLLHAMAGLTDIDAGKITVDGQDLAKVQRRAAHTVSSRTYRVSFSSL